LSHSSSAALLGIAWKVPCADAPATHATTRVGTDRWWCNLNTRGVARLWPWARRARLVCGSGPRRASGPKRYGRTQVAARVAPEAVAKRGHEARHKGVGGANRIHDLHFARRKQHDARRQRLILQCTQYHTLSGHWALVAIGV
jgi:hypothetical protein